MPSEKRTIVVTKKARSLVEFLDQLVETKKSIGFETSFSAELLRLAMNGLYHETNGAELDRRVLKEMADERAGSLS